MKKGTLTEGLKKESAQFLYYMRTTLLIRRVDSFTTDKM